MQKLEVEDWMTLDADGARSASTVVLILSSDLATRIRKTIDCYPQHNRTGGEALLVPFDNEM